MSRIRLHQDGARLHPGTFGPASDQQVPAHDHDELKAMMAVTSGREAWSPHDHRRGPSKRATIWRHWHTRGPLDRARSPFQPVYSRQFYNWEATLVDFWVALDLAAHRPVGHQGCIVSSLKKE